MKNYVIIILSAVFITLTACDKLPIQKLKFWQKEEPKKDSKLSAENKAGTVEDKHDQQDKSDTSKVTEDKEVQKDVEKDYYKDFSFAKKLREKKIQLEIKETLLNQKEEELNRKETALEDSKNKKAKNSISAGTQVEADSKKEDAESISKREEKMKVLMGIMAAMKDDAASQMIAKMEIKTASEIMKIIPKDKAAKYFSGMPKDRAIAITKVMLGESDDTNQQTKIVKNTKTSKTSKLTEAEDNNGNDLKRTLPRYRRVNTGSQVGRQER